MAYRDDQVRNILNKLTPEDFYKQSRLKEKQVIDSLPKSVRVYRGFNNGRKNLRGWSWSLSKDIAYRFTWYIGNNTKGNVVSCEVPKSSIIFYNNEMGEHEVLISPQKINWENIEVVMKNVRFKAVRYPEKLPEVPVESFLKLKPRKK